MDVQSPLCISRNSTNHAAIGTYPYYPHLSLLTSKIAIVLILEYACILFAAPSRPTREEALDKACSQYISSHTDNAVHLLLLLSPRPYSPQKIIEFVLMHRLR